jgi:hypothetical protein
MSRNLRSYTEAQLRSMLPTERTAITERLMALKAHVPAQLAEIGDLENRLDDVTASEDFLAERYGNQGEDDEEVDDRRGAWCAIRVHTSTRTRGPI